MVIEVPTLHYLKSQNQNLSSSEKLLFWINMEQGFPLKKIRLDKLKLQFL